MPPMREERFDIAVVGGGSAGAAAAVAAARLGAKVVLIERYGFLGGAATHSFVMTYDGFLYRGDRPQWAVGGIGRELLGELDRFASKVEPVLSPNKNWVLPFNPESAKAALDSLVIRASVSTRLHATVVEASFSGNRIVSLVAADHAGRFTIAADAFIDASGEGNLSALADVPMAFAEEPRYAASLCVRIAGVPQDIVVDRAFLARVCSTVPADETPAILRADGGFVLRLPENGDLWWMGVDILTDGVSSASLSEAEQKCRATAWAFVRQLRRVAGCERATLAASGPQLGIRETRHPQARYMISDGDALAGRRVDTPVARAVWPVERHDTPGKTHDGADRRRRILRHSGRLDPCEAASTIYGSPGAPSVPSAGAFSSLRVMGTGFATGQAAGTAAALALQGRPDYSALRAALLDQGAVL